MGPHFLSITESASEVQEVPDFLLCVKLAASVFSCMQQTKSKVKNNASGDCEQGR